MKHGKRPTRQQTILQFIKSYTAENSYSPTVREIAKAVGLASTSTVQGHLERLELKKLIRRNGRRIVVINDDNDESVKILKENDGNVTAIQWRGRRFIYDPMG